MNDLKGIIEDCNKSDLVSDKVIKKIIEIIGQEEWQDLHDENSDICTTMGELIITLNGIAELEKSCDETQELLDKQIEATYKLDKENAELSEKLNRHKHDCPNCSAFGKHCPHRVNGDPYTYDCYLTVAELEKENAELRNNGFTVSAMTEQQLKVALEKGEQLEKENAELSEKLSEQKQYTAFKCNEFVKKKEVYEREHFLLTTAKEIIKKLKALYFSPVVTKDDVKRQDEILAEAEQFLKDSEVE